MTPEQIQTAVETAISQGNLFPWWSYVLCAVFAGLASYVAVYLREKGKNSATKEDIGEITKRIEEVKLETAKELHRFQITSSGLLKKRAEVIEELYHLIVDTEETFGRFVGFAEDNPTKDKLRKEGGSLLYEFLRKYKKNRIYFSEEVCEKLKSYSDSISEVIMPFSFALTIQIEEGHFKDFTNQWIKSNEDYNKKIPKVRKTIEEEFRRLLSVEEI